MRLLLMAHAWPPRHCAGGEMMLRTMLAPLVARGHDVHVLLSRDWQPDDYVDDLGIKVHAFRTRDDPWSHMDKADVVVSHLENAPRATILARMLGKPHVYVVHNDKPASRTWVQDDTALVVFNSQWMADELGPHPRQIIVRPPVLAEEYRTTPGDRVTLINLWADKGGKVFWRLAEAMPDVPFLGVTGGYGPQEPGELPNVEVLPHVRGADQMRERVYARTRLLLMPSVYESWGRTAVEAMVSGIPVVAHSTPGLVECLGSAGVFADRDRLDDWVQAIRLLLTRRRAWTAASKAALARAAQLDPTEDLARWIDAVEALA